jgi:hypothetical protein
LQIVEGYVFYPSTGDQELAVQHGSPIWRRFSGEHGGHPRQPRRDLLQFLHGDLTALVTATSPTASVQAPTTSDAVASSGKKSKTHPPKPYDIV